MTDPAEILRELEQITPWPWYLADCSHGGKILLRPGGAQDHVQILPVIDAEFIARAPERLKAMCERVIELEAQLKGYPKVPKPGCSKCGTAHGVFDACVEPAPPAEEK